MKKTGRAAGANVIEDMYRVRYQALRVECSDDYSAPRPSKTLLSCGNTWIPHNTEIGAAAGFAAV